MKRILLISFVLMSALISEAWAQRTVSGEVVSAASGEGLPGVSVRVQGTSTGVITDLDGNFRLQVPEDANTLVFSFVGFETQEVAIGNRSVVDVTLAEDVQQLQEVVVTALNISREKASLGYATQELDAEDVSRVKETNIVNSLSGKVAGVNVRTNNTMGGSTNIVIRGNNSITGDNQPLFIVDGVPIDNRTGNTAYQQRGGVGYDYGNAAADINPEEVESINVLKGAAATALYGSRASNGVVLITTKKGAGRKGIGIDLSSGVTVGKIQRSTFPVYQNQYGAGYGPFYGNGGYFYDDDIDGDGDTDFVVPTTEDASYGGQFNPNLMVYQWDAFAPDSPNFGQPTPWVAAENGPEEFFETQVTYNNSLAFYGGTENTTFRLGYTNLQMKDILPNSEMTRHTINFNGASQINERLKADVMVQYNYNDVIGRFSTGYNDNLMTQFRQWWQTNVDILEQKEIYERTGLNYTWNTADYTDPLTPIYWDNPYWTRYENYNSDNRSRIIGNVGLTYEVAEGINVTGSASVDTYTEVREERRQAGSVPTAFGVNLTDESSGYLREDRAVSEYNFNLMLTANKEINEDLSFSGLIGTNIRRNTFESVRSSTSGGLAVPGVWALSNSVSTNPFPTEFATEKEVYGFFANANLGWKNMLYLDLTDRIDISSALPIDNNLYNYYSGALSFVFTEAVDIDWLDFGKVRVSYGEVGSDTDAGRTIDTYIRNDNFGNTIINTISPYKRNPELRPERLRSWEAGLNLSALQNRVGLDFSVYRNTAFDQIIEVATSDVTGYAFTYVNGGEIENRGIELVLTGGIVRTNDFSWNTTINWTLNRSEVLALPEGIENFVINDFGGVTANAAVGQPFGVLRGTGFQYLDGQRVVATSGINAGMYVAVPDQIIGDPNPDWIGGITNTLSYKGLALSFLVDMQTGGDLYSLDMHYGQGTGLYEHTVGLNDRGVPIRYPVSEGGGVLQPGVTETGEQNTTYARADWYRGVFYWGNSTINPNALTVYDASYVKLREASLTYTLPKNLVDGWAQNVNLSLVGRNLWIIHKNLPYSDPESGLGAGNAQGYLVGSYPTVRTIGFKVDVRF